MMSRFINVLLYSVAAFSFCCTPVPERETDGPVKTQEQKISIAYLKSLYNGHPVNILKDYTVTGWVMSTDRFGNYDRTIALHDETGGIEIRIGMDDLFMHFSRGDILEINCNSLTLGAYGQMVQLGSGSNGGYEAGYLDENIISAHITKTGVKSEKPEAIHLGLDEIEVSLLGCLVRIDGVQFENWDSELTWAKRDEDTNRVIIDASGNSLFVRTSKKAAFASRLLPEGSGYIEGVLSWFNDDYQLRVVDPRQVNMKGERFENK